MGDATVGICFLETMAGGFAMGETNPEAGLQKGQSAGTSLALHATVSIPDLDLLLDQPDHPGALAGSIESSLFGGVVEGTDGVFKLFNPSGQAGLKYMVYELGFQWNGQPYYLAGRKEVRDGPPLEAWRQTTTLYTRLHQGTDASWPIAGAGILSLEVADLIRMLGTINTPGAGDAAQAAEALARFGRFFLGQLWDSYGVHLPRG
jgi:hypothetical protein